MLCCHDNGIVGLLVCAKFNDHTYIVLYAHTKCKVIGERERANLIVQRARFFWYIYIYIYIYHGRCHTANRLHVSKLTQLTIFHRSSPHVYRHGDSSRRCTVATVQDEANPSSSQPAASCCVASESTEAHRDGWREYVLAEESVLPRKQPKRKRGV